MTAPTDPALESRRIKANVARCRDCGTLLCSEHRHDFTQCLCGNFLDGGRDYVRYGGKNADALELLTVYADA